MRIAYFKVYWILIGGILLGLLTVQGSSPVSSSSVNLPTATVNPFLHRPDPTGIFHFKLEELTGHPHFWWPESLLDYRLDLSQVRELLSDYRLFDGHGELVPFQWTDLPKGGQRGTLSFFSDLPSGSTREFTFRPVPNVPVPPRASVLDVKEHEGFWRINNGSIVVCLASGLPAPSDKLSGNLLTISSRGRDLASGRLKTSRTLQACRVELTQKGPLRAGLRLEVSLEGGAVYALAIDIATGMDYFTMKEFVRGLPLEERSAFELNWTGLHPDERRGGLGMDTPYLTKFRGEDPAFVGQPGAEIPEEDYYYRLGPASADSTACSIHEAFLENSTGLGVALCAIDPLEWTNDQYSTWTSWPRQDVRFRYRAPCLTWSFPLVNGTRKTAISVFMGSQATQISGGMAWDVFLESRLGSMGLNRVKDWILRVPEGAPEPSGLPHEGQGKEMQSLKAYLDSFWTSQLVKCEGGWVHPVGLRCMNRWVVPGFQKWKSQMAPEERRKVEALLLFTSYIAAREESSPMVNMMGGHPNFMADWKYPLMAGAWLFPWHPMAKEWADQFDQFMKLASVFCVRPAVEEWGTRGGRWTESLGIYNWAFLDPAAMANQMGLAYDGRNRFLHPGIALHGMYLANTVSAPLRLSIPAGPAEHAELTPQNGFQRVHPPMGAHAGRRRIPAVMNRLGEWMAHYRPEVSAALLWASQTPTGGNEGNTDPKSTAKPLAVPPSFRSCKFTGYGFVLRSGVDTKQEMAVYLQQVDQGPNYRWGFGNEGGCGDIYYYAAGNSYSGHLGEDAGDRRVCDAELTSNTGVYRDHGFRAIGMNNLTEDLFALGSCQWAAIHPRRGAGSYAWPEYVERAVMMMGSDYIVVSDFVDNMSRSSWSVAKGDLMPQLIPLRGELAYRISTESKKGKDSSTVQRFDPYKGGGDRLMLVTHRDDVAHVKSNTQVPYDVIKTQKGWDVIWVQRSVVETRDLRFSFRGSVGSVRHFDNKDTELNLIRGTSIGDDQLRVVVEQGQGTLSLLRSAATGSVTGTWFSREPATLRMEWVKGAQGEGFVATDAKRNLDGVWIDGKALAHSSGANLRFAMPAGQHRLSLGAKPSLPEPPDVGKSAPADMAWDSDSARSSIAVTQALASSASASAGSALEAPVGLRVEINQDQADLSWGQLPGAACYQLYRRPRGGDWQVVWKGNATQFRDQLKGIAPPQEIPGLEAEAKRPEPSSIPIWEYAVSACNEHGESPLSLPEDTDPTRWNHWRPKMPLVFQRRSGYHQPPYIPESSAPPAYYP